MSVRDIARRAAKALFADNQAVRERLRRLDIWLSARGPGHARPPASGLDGSLAFGVNVAGFFGGEFGVAQAARADVMALKAAGLPFVLNNVASSRDRYSGTGGSAFSKDNPYLVNLVHVNADEAGEFRRKAGDGYFAGRYNIGYWVWELPEFPERFASGFGQFHEIWTPSRFSMDAISRLSPVPVVRMPHAIDAAGLSVPPDRARFGMGDGEFVFLFMFDFYSVYDRKNPVAVIDAFRSAFGDGRGARLVIKHINSERFGVDLARFEKRANGPNITVIGDRLSRADTCSLMASCDCYVSLHRAEGFGLTIAEAMALGKPVIATAFSGNTDFMDVSNSFPVRYGTARLDRDLPPYGKGSEWADPDVGHAAEMMRLVYGDPEARGRMSVNARETVQRVLSPEAVGRLYARRLGLVTGRAAGGQKAG
ncbi:MAG: glycosyltransferase family 4 protein [Nitrospirae bacterium]|nr:glycosyltransferase family 4 protein [Nitrospirota bacterium]MBI5694195.1 glycosyltransferase family 4 protein [Nitrospirota bacterium]